MPPNSTKILIIRHAEKPGDPGSDKAEDGPDLSAKGFQRADALATYVPAEFGRPDFLFATQQGNHSNRPVETITPLSKALGIEIDHDTGDDDFAEVAQQILSDSIYDGKLILICWHHGKIPKLTAALGGIPPQKHWPDDVFDRVWSLEITKPPGGPGVAVENIPQKLLPGDSDT